MGNKYYLVYQTGKIVKNLDISTLAREEYIRVEVDNELPGVYRYTYEDAEGRRFGISFTQKMLDRAHVVQQKIIDFYCRAEKFTPQKLIHKVRFITQSQFDKGEANGTI